MSNLRIAVLDGLWPRENYLVAVYPNGQEVTNAELEALDLYRRFLRQRFYLPHEILKMDEGDIDICIGNGATFIKYPDGSWSYRHWSWHEAGAWPNYFSNHPYRFYDINNLINHMEKLIPENWQDFKEANS
jgi:hypothetical protein